MGMISLDPSQMPSMPSMGDLFGSLPSAHDVGTGVGTVAGGMVGMPGLGGTLGGMAGDGAAAIGDMVGGAASTVGGWLGGLDPGMLRMSDERLKTEIAPITGALDLLSR